MSKEESPRNRKQEDKTQFLSAQLKILLNEASFDYETVAKYDIHFECRKVQQASAGEDAASPASKCW